MRRLRVESTDSEIDQACVETMQPYNLHEVTGTVAGQPLVREDGAIERVEPTVEMSTTMSPGQELRENFRVYSKRLEDYKRSHPQFAAYGDPNTPIPIAEPRRPGLDGTVNHTREHGQFTDN